MWLVLNDLGMSERERGLERAEKDNERGDQHEINRCRDHQRGDLIEDEFDEEFWIKVKAGFITSFCDSEVYFFCLTIDYLIY